MIRNNGDMESESDRSDCEGMPPLEDSDVLGYKTNTSGSGKGR